jgi:hypothetical protein
MCNKCGSQMLRKAIRLEKAMVTISIHFPPRAYFKNWRHSRDFSFFLVVRSWKRGGRWYLHSFIHLAQVSQKSRRGSISRQGGVGLFEIAHPPSSAFFISRERGRNPGARRLHRKSSTPSTSSPEGGQPRVRSEEARGWCWQREGRNDRVIRTAVARTGEICGFREERKWRQCCGIVGPEIMYKQGLRNFKTRLFQLVVITRSYKIG